ncbi:MAG: hypothetical protein JST30_02100 [Armatimonadetes bacterium]|nr:hypothetical protein [Armatimonadota bacterium]
MNMGNKGQAIALSVVAVGAVGFMVLQIQGAAGRAARNLHAAVSGAIGGKSEEAPRSGLPTTFYGDPFSHPALPRSERQSPVPESRPTGQEVGGESPSRLRGGSLFGSPPLPIGDVMTAGNLAGLPTTLQKSEDPAPVKGPNVVLQAIVMATTPMAFVTVDGGEPKRCRIGDSPADGLVIVAIREGAVDLKFSKHRKTLTVGESIQL